MVSYFSQSKGQGLEKVFLLHIIIFEWFFYNKKIDIALGGTFDLFFTSRFSTFPIISLLISSSNFFTIIE